MNHKLLQNTASSVFIRSGHMAGIGVRELLKELKCPKQKANG